MADLKISALTASTTPLAGTEVLPIVQSSTTKQVSVANLTAGRAVSALSYASTTGALFATTSGNVGVGPATASVKLHVQGVSSAISGTAKATTLIDDTTALAANVGGAITFRGKYTSAGDYSAAAYVQAQKVNATDSNDSFDLVFGTRENGNGTAEALRLTDVKDVKVTTGNLVIGTSGKGIDFSATSHPAGMTSELLADYEEGTYTATITPETSGTITLSGSVDLLKYTKTGRVVTVTGRCSVSSVSSPVGGTIRLNLPFAISTSTEAESRIGGAISSYNNVTTVNYAIIGDSGSSSIDIYVNAATIAAGMSFSVSFSYCA